MFLRLRGRYSRGRLRIFEPSRNFHHTPDLRSNEPKNPNRKPKSVDELLTDAQNVEYQLNSKNSYSSSSSTDDSNLHESGFKQTISLADRKENIQFAYKENKSTHHSNPLHLFTTNSTLNGQNLLQPQPPTESQTSQTSKAKLSQLLYGLFQGSANLVHNIDLGAQSSIDYSVLSDSLREKVNNQLDTYNKFTLLLNQHPLAVPPLLLLGLYSLVTSILPSDRQALLRALVYHQEWTYFWNLAFVDTTTLADVEDITDLIHSEVTKCNCEDLAIWQALLAAQGEIDNSRLLGTLCESMAYKFDLKKSDVVEFCQTFNPNPEGLFIESYALPSQRALKVAVYLGSLDQENIDFEVIRSCLLQNDVSFKVRGFTTKLLQTITHPSLVEFIVKRPTLKLNELDLFHLWQHNSPEIEERLSILLIRELRRNTRISESVKSSILTQVKDSQLKIALANKFHSTLSQMTISDHFSFLIDSKMGRKLLRKIKKNRFDSFETAATMYIEKLRKQLEAYNEPTMHPSSDIDKGLNTKMKPAEAMDAQRLKTYREPTTLEKLIWILAESSHNNSHLITRVLSVLEGTKTNLDSLMKLKLPVGELLEVWKFSIRHKLLDEGFALLLFQEILRKTWDFDHMARRNEDPTRIENLDDFQRCFKNATVSEQKNLNYQLYSIALPLVKCEIEYTAFIVNSLYGAILSIEKSNVVNLSKEHSQYEVSFGQPLLNLTVKTGATGIVSARNVEEISTNSSYSSDTKEERMNHITVSSNTAESAHSSIPTHSLKHGGENSNVNLSHECTGNYRTKMASKPAGMKEVSSFALRSKSRNPRLMDISHNSALHEPVSPYRPCQHNYTGPIEFNSKSSQLSKFVIPKDNCSMGGYDDSMKYNCLDWAEHVDEVSDETTRLAQDEAIASLSQTVQKELSVLRDSVSVAIDIWAPNAAGVTRNVDVDGIDIALSKDRDLNAIESRCYTNSETQTRFRLNAGMSNRKSERKREALSNAGLNQTATQSILVNDESHLSSDFNLQLSNKTTSPDAGFSNEKERTSDYLKRIGLFNNDEKLSKLQETLSISPQNLSNFQKPTFTLFQSIPGRRFVMLKLIKYLMQQIYEKQPDTEGIRHMGDILKSFKFDSRIGQAAVFEFMVMHQPAAAFKILRNYETNKPFLVRPLMNAVEQGILRLDRLTLEEKLRYYEKFQALKVQLKYSAQPSRKTVTMWGELAMREARGDGDKTRQIVAKALQKKIPLRIIRSWNNK